MKRHHPRTLDSFKAARGKKKTQHLCTIPSDIVWSVLCCFMKIHLDDSPEISRDTAQRLSDLLVWPISQTFVKVGSVSSQRTLLSGNVWTVSWPETGSRTTTQSTPLWNRNWACRQLWWRRAWDSWLRLVFWFSLYPALPCLSLLLQFFRRALWLHQSGACGHLMFQFHYSLLKICWSLQLPKFWVEAVVQQRQRPTYQAASKNKVHVSPASCWLLFFIFNVLYF